MGILIRYKYHLAALHILVGLMMISAKTKTVQATVQGAQDLPAVETRGQLDQAMELLKAQQAAQLLASEMKTDIRSFILKKVTDSLPKAHRHRAFEISRSLIVEANHHRMDPLFLMAVINTESHFNPMARGRHGEIGLMQILPKTAAWIAPQAGIASDKIDLEDPCLNIRIGATYFAQLRKSFNGKGTRYVSAYNMGPTNVRRLVAGKVEPKIYSSKVLGAYNKFYAALEKTQSTSLTRNIASSK